jgi:hypothetical protein
MKLFLGIAAASLLGVIAMPSAGDEAIADAATGPAALSPGVAATPVADAPPSAAGSSRYADAATVERQQTRALQLVWRRDPFAPAVRSVEPEVPQPVAVDDTRPRLLGTSISGDQRRAIIGQRVVRPGDVLGTGHVIQSIARSTVTVSLGDEQTVITIEEQP